MEDLPQRRPVTTIIKTGGCHTLSQAIGVGAAILEAEGIDGSKASLMGSKLPGSAITTMRSLLRSVVVTPAHNTGIGLQVLDVDHQAAFRAFGPEAIPVIGSESPCQWTDLAAVSE